MIQRFLFFVLVLLLLAAAAAALTLGLPLPTTDDLFFYGAPIRLAEGGGLANPPLRGFLQGMGTEAYFCHLPLHAWILGFWLKLWGVSAASLLGFAWATFALGAPCLLVLLRRLGWRREEQVLLLLVYFTLHFASASRPDGLALALALAGAAALSFESRGRLFLGAWLLAAGVLAYPMAAIWGLLFAALRWVTTPSATRLPWAAFVVPVGLAAVLWAGLFWGMVDGRVGEWWRIFQATRAERGRPLWLIAEMVGDFLRNPRKDVLCVPALLCLPVALVLAWRSRGVGLAFPTAALALLASLGCGLLYFAHSALQTAIFCGFLGAGAVVAAAGPLGRSLGLLALTGSYVVTFSLWWTQAAFRQEPPEAERAAARTAAALAVAEKRPLRVDSASARYAFDFRLPPEAFDVIYSTFQRPYSPEFASRETGRETWIVARSWIRFLFHAPAELRQYPSLTIRGRNIDTVPLRPYEIVVLAPPAP